MNYELDDKLKLLFETAVICENESRIRSLCSEIIAGAQAQENNNAVSVCKKKLRLLENEKCRKEKSIQFKELDLSKLIENLSLCSDIILSDCGKRISCETEKCMVSGNPQFIVNAFMNLISNCAKFGNDGTISICVKNTDDCIVITAQNSGIIDFSKIKGGGIAAAANTAKLHSGRLLYASKGNKVEAAFSIEKATKKAEQKYTVPDCTAFLTDEFSPVHIGLADVLL